jgi:hypothetical protein
MLLVRPALVIEIMQERRETPYVLIGESLPRVGPHARFDGQHVSSQIFVGGVFAK